MKKKIYQQWWFYALILLIVASVLTFFTVSLKILLKPRFEIKDYTITGDTTNYTSITNTTSYEGEGLVTSNYKKGTYLVALKVTLESGGSESSRQEYVTIVTVNDGEGRFATYDSGDVGKIKKPKYNFQVIGYMKFK